MVVVAVSAVQSMVVVAESAVQSMVVVAESAVQSMVVVAESAVQSMVVVAVSAVQSMVVVAVSAVQSMVVVAESAVQSMVVVAVSAVQSMVVVAESAVQSMVVVAESAVQSMVVVAESAVQSMVVVAVSAVQSMVVVAVSAVQSMVVVAESAVQSMVVVAVSAVQSMVVVAVSAVQSMVVVAVSAVQSMVVIAVSAVQSMVVIAVSAVQSMCLEHGNCRCTRHRAAGRIAAKGGADDGEGLVHPIPNSHSQEAAPRLPALKLSMKRTQRRSRVVLGHAGGEEKHDGSGNRSGGVAIHHQGQHDGRMDMAGRMGKAAHNVRDADDDVAYDEGRKLLLDDRGKGRAKGGGQERIAEGRAEGRSAGRDGERGEEGGERRGGGVKEMFVKECPKQHGGVEEARGGLGGMEEGMVQLQQRLRSAEAKAEEVLLVKQELVDLDRQRNAGREAITALKKHARGAAARRAGGRREAGSGGGAAGGGVSAEAHRPLVTPLPAVPVGTSGLDGSSECAVCGAVGQKERVWVVMGGGEMFVRLPLHHAHVHVKRAIDPIDPHFPHPPSGIDPLFPLCVPHCPVLPAVDRIDVQMEEGREKQKAAVRQLTEEGGLAGRVGEGIVHALTTLKDAGK
ncbi:unnamed protein product [Closterium sp. NIES-65]|nr:unnamed protein product [Closterium sp. NIES-65]